MADAAGTIEQEKFSRNVIGHNGKFTNHSQLMVERHKAMQKFAVAYVCPYGCGEDECDQNGYCDHLVGFTCGEFDEKEKTNNYFHASRRCDPIDPDTGEPIRRMYRIDGKSKHKVKTGDVLVRGTVSWRVYRRDGIDSLED